MNELPRGVKRTRYACERCRQRKQKCDSDGSPCSSCTRLGIACVIPEVPSKDYTKKLESRVSELQQQIRNLEKQIETQANDSPGNKSNSSYESNLTNYATSISLGYEPQAGPYLGLSSGVNLASLIQGTIGNQDEINADTLHDTGTEKVADGLINTARANPPLVEMSEIYGKRMVQLYIDLVHVRFPVLDIHEIWSLYESRKALLDAPIDDTQLQINRFKLLMIYAAGLRHGQLVYQEHFQLLSPEVLHKAACSRLGRFVHLVNTPVIQCLLLLVLYLLRSMSSTGIWQIVGLAMRNCVELGLHRKESYDITPENVRMAIMRRRVFWFTYSLERLACQSFGRPFSLSERDIDVSLPWDIPETIEDDNELSELVNNYYPSNRETPLTFALYFLSVRRIDSQVQEQIYRSDIKDLPHIRQMEPYLEKIRQWRARIPKDITSVQKNHVELMYHKCIRHVLIPYLSILDANDPYCVLVLQASGTLCQISKKLHQGGHYAHSFVALQTVFMCGLTLVYALITKKTEWNFRISDDLQACSTVMFVVAEKVKSTRRYRDMFEALLTNTRAYLQSSCNGNGTTTQPEPTATSSTLTADSNDENFEDMSMEQIWKIVYGSAWPEGSDIAFDPESWIRMNNFEFG